MRFFIDCEFNGFGGELISIALVPSDDSIPSLYVLVDFQEPPVEWVAQNVMPILGDHQVLPRDEAARNVAWYLRRYGGEKVELVADWPDDIVHFSKLLMTGPGKMVNCPNFSFHFVRWQRGMTEVSKISAIPHNALSDATALKRIHEGEVTAEELTALGGD